MLASLLDPELAWPPPVIPAAFLTSEELTGVLEPQSPKMVDFANSGRPCAANRARLRPLGSERSEPPRPNYPKNYQPENVSFEKDQKEATAADPVSSTVSTTGFVFLRYA